MSLDDRYDALSADHKGIVKGIFFLGLFAIAMWVLWIALGIIHFLMGIFTFLPVIAVVAVLASGMWLYRRRH